MEWMSVPDVDDVDDDDGIIQSWNLLVHMYTSSNNLYDCYNSAVFFYILFN